MGKGGNPTDPERLPPTLWDYYCGAQPKGASGCGAKSRKAGRTKQNSDSLYQVDAHMPPSWILSFVSFVPDSIVTRSINVVILSIGPLVSVRQ